jgi:hypothetical protein
MHCTITTIAHRLTSHTHPIPVHQQNQQTRVDSTRLTPPFSPPRRAMSNRPGPISLFGGQASSSCSAADSSGMQQNLIRPPLDHLDWLPSCFSTMDLRPEPTAHSVHLLPRLIVLCPCTSVSGVRGARDRLKPRGSRRRWPIRLPLRKSQHRMSQGELGYAVLCDVFLLCHTTLKPSPPFSLTCGRE